MKNSFCFFLLFFTAISLHAQVTIVKAPLYMYNYAATVNDKILFFATDAIDANYELWVSDGTTAGTKQLMDILPGADGSILDNSYWGPQYSDKEPVIYKNELYFLAFDPDHGMEIWKSDGTEEGTEMLRDIHPGGEGYLSPEFNYPYFTEMDGILYFAANDGDHGFELWKTDGTEAGTEMVRDISSDDIYGSNPEHLIVFNDKIYFTARDDIYGYEIYKSDGTAGGTEIVKDIVPGINGSMNDGFAGSIDPQFTVSGDYLYFTGRINAEPLVAVYLYRTDGTEAGTITLNNDLKDVTQLTDVDGTCFLYAFDGNFEHSGLWKTDGTTDGTVNIETDNIFASTNFYNFNNTLYFSGINADYTEIGLYKSDGAGTELVKEFEGLASFPEVGDYITEPGGSSFFYRALFKITESAMDWRYVQTNGTTEGTKIFWDASPFRGSTFLDGKLYFPGIDTMADEWALYSLTPDDLVLNVSQQAEKKLSIYPNPSGGSATIILPFEMQGALLEIIDQSGNKMLSTIISTISDQYMLNTNALSDGLYFIKIIQHDKTYTDKLMVIH